MKRKRGRERERDRRGEEGEDINSGKNRRREGRKVEGRNNT